MPFFLIGLGAAFFGAQIDNAIQSKFSTPVRVADGFSSTRLLLTAGGVVAIGLGVKKLLS